MYEIAEKERGVFRKKNQKCHTVTNCHTRAKVANETIKQFTASSNRNHFYPYKNTSAGIPQLPLGFTL